MFDEERRKQVTKIIETIRLRHALGMRTCLGYADPPERDIDGEMVCPRCGGSLKYAISSYNGATRGRCGSRDCLYWAE